MGVVASWVGHGDELAQLLPKKVEALGWLASASSLSRLEIKLREGVEDVECRAL